MATSFTRSVLQRLRQYHPLCMALSRPCSLSLTQNIGSQPTSVCTVLHKTKGNLQIQKSYSTYMCPHTDSFCHSRCGSVGQLDHVSKQRRRYCSEAIQGNSSISYQMSRQDRLLDQCKSRYLCNADVNHKCRFSNQAKNSRHAVLTFIDTEKDMEEYLAQLQSSLNLTDNSSSGRVSLEHLKRLVPKLVALQCDTRSIHSMLGRCPKILTANPEKLSGNIDFLHELGLNWRRLLKVLEQSPAIWSVSLGRLQERVQELRRLGFAEGQLQRMVSDCPLVLTISKNKLKGVVRVLMERCEFSKINVIQILMDCPNLLNESLESIEVRFQYVYFRMGILDNQEITQAKVFHYSLDHIRCRHLVLERLGLYAAPDTRGRFTNQNPNLPKIVDSSDGRFAEKVAKISAEELEVFARTLLKEIEAEKRERDAGSSSGDSDDDDDGSHDDDSELSDADMSSATEEPFDFDKVDFRKKSSLPLTKNKRH